VQQFSILGNRKGPQTSEDEQRPQWCISTRGSFPDTTSLHSTASLHVFHNDSLACFCQLKLTQKVAVSFPAG